MKALVGGCIGIAPAQQPADEPVGEQPQGHQGMDRPYPPCCRNPAGRISVAAGELIHEYHVAKALS